MEGCVKFHAEVGVYVKLGADMNGYVKITLRWRVI
jgi:hypothetical protein